MDDSLNTGNDNKLPLFIGIGAIAVALLALLFAFKARGDAKTATEKLAGIESSIASAQTEISTVKNTSAKIADVQEVAGKLDELKTSITTAFDQLARNDSEQNKVITLLSKGGAGKGATTTAANGTTAKTGVAAPAAGAGEYAVKKGDTFRKIATASGVTVVDLSKANPGVDSAKLKVGQIIKVPAKK